MQSFATLIKPTLLKSWLQCGRVLLPTGLLRCQTVAALTAMAAPGEGLVGPWPPLEVFWPLGSTHFPLI